MLGITNGVTDAKPYTKPSHASAVQSPTNKSEYYFVFSIRDITCEPYGMF